MKLKIILLIIALGCAPLIAQENEITLDDAIKTALENNRQIEIAKMDVRKADRKVSEAFGYALPSVDVSAGFTHFLQKPKMSFPDFEAMLNNSTYGVLFKEDIIPYDPGKLMPLDFKLQTFVQANNFQTQAQVSQILFNSAVFQGIGASQIYLNLAKENLKRTIAKTALDVKNAFYGVLLTRDLYEIAQARFTNANEHLKNIKAMLAQGLVSNFAEMQAEVQVENIRPILVQLKNANIDATNGLKILLNIKQDEDISVIGKMEYKEEELPTIEELINEAKKSNLSLKTLKIKNQLDKEFAAIDRGGYWPTLVAFGNYTFAGTSENWDFQNYTSSTVGLNFSINLFQGGRTKHKVEQDMIVAEQTAEQIKSLSDATEMQVKSKYNDLLRVRQQIEAMKSNVALAERAYQIAENRYKEGEGSQLEVKDADVSLTNAKVNYTNAVHDYLVAKAALYNLIGRIDKKYYDYVSEELNDKE
ncbi:MAG: TolC family protein [Chlorobi bacterium]|nr:TolC family protein [Chlorobiota bacterium]